MKNIIITLLIILAISLGLYFLILNSPSIEEDNQEEATTTPNQFSQNEPIVQTEIDKTKTIIGKSVEGRDIVVYHYGELESGSEILFIGGIHGGYAWNTSLLAFEVMDYLKDNPQIIPTNFKISVLPVLNPDGLFVAIGTSTRFTLTDIPTSQTTLNSGRFNANEVDLNRNFDCNWQTTGKWQNKTVSGGKTVFSEPESLVIKNYINSKKPQAVIVWYSAGGGVYSSACHNGILPETKELTKIYAQASGYTSHEEFDSYEITGDMVNWLAKENIPAISVLLTNHIDTDLIKNLEGLKALFKYYVK